MTIIHRKKLQFSLYLIFGLLFVSFFTSCEDGFVDNVKYQQPDRLDGKVYTLISRQANMSIFAQFMVDVGYDKLVDKTGTYAAFVPTDSVMKIYLMDKYGTIDPAQIDSTVKSKIVRYHILSMPWSLDQLQNLSSRGWINFADISNNKPTAFKRRTLLREDNRTYKIQRFLSGNEPFEIIVPNSNPSTITRTVFNSSAKYVPLFFDGFMDAKGLGTSDYSFYFNRPYERGQVFYANSKVTGKEIFAENGFVYAIDKVVEPLKNAEEIMLEGSYSKFLQLINNNSVFVKNDKATLAQEGASEGKVVTDLYNLSYTSSHPMNIHDEIISSANNTVERHNGILVPTDAAMDDFFNQYLRSWGSTWSSVPKNIQRLFVNTHMSQEPIYPKDINSGFYNAVGDILRSSDIDVEKSVYGSNSTFIGLKKAVIPRFFSSVSAPLFLERDYNSFLGSYASVNLISALKDPNRRFSFFVIDNASLSRDSSLTVTELPNGRYQVQAYNHAEQKTVNMTSSEYLGVFTRRLYGQVGIQPILGAARKEFIETLDGRHIVIQNDTVSGGVPAEFGFNSGRDTTVVFSEITNFPINNGKVYRANGWIKYPTANSYNYLRGTKFLTLLNKAGLASVLNERLTFMSTTERYTIFVPSDAALNSVNADNLSVAELRDLLSFHIIKGNFVFTDGRQPKGAYRTLNDKFIRLDPRPDNLLILDRNNNVLYNQLVLSSTANLIGMTTQNIAENYYITNAVIHRINTVIAPY